MTDTMSDFQTELLRMIDIQKPSGRCIAIEGLNKAPE